MHRVNCKNQMNQKSQSSDNCQRALERNTRPNDPRSAPGSARRPRRHQPIFPKILRESRECATLLLTTAIRARGSAATRLFATHEHRLPTQPRSPNHAERTAALPARPCRIRPLVALPPKPCFRTSQIVSDRLRSSGIVSDRLRSSERTAAHRPPFPQNCRIVRPIPPARPAKKRVISRQYAAKYARKRP